MNIISMKYFVFIALIGLLLASSCSNYSSSSSDRKSTFDEWYLKGMESLANYKSTRDTMWLDTADVAAEKLQQNFQSLGVGLMIKAQSLVYRKKYDEAEKLMRELRVGRFVMPEYIYPGYSTAVAEYIEALKAQDSNDSAGMMEHLMILEKTMHDVIYSDCFNLKALCENKKPDSQETIFKMIVLRKWSKTLRKIGGNERVVAELKNIIDLYNPGEDNLIRQEYDNEISLLQQNKIENLMQQRYDINGTFIDKDTLKLSDDIFNN